MDPLLENLFNFFFKHSDCSGSDEVPEPQSDIEQPELQETVEIKDQLYDDGSQRIQFFDVNK